MDRRPIAATVALSAVALVFASLVGIAIALYLFAALNGASTVGLLVGGSALFVFGTLALSAIHGLRVASLWPLLGVAAGFCGFWFWLALLFRLDD